MKEVITNIKVTIKVPFSKVDEASQKIVDLLTEMDLYDGATLEQSKATIDL